MRTKYLALVLLAGFALVEAAAQTKQPQPSPHQGLSDLMPVEGTLKPIAPAAQPVQVTSPSDTYMIAMHTSVPAEDSGNFPGELYTIVHGTETLKVRYSESQTSSAKPGDFPGSGLHLHISYSNPDLSQVPLVGVPTRACLFNKNRDKDGDLVIAVQPTPEPCIASHSI